MLNLNGPLHGETRVAGDKSITHRALIFSSLAQGKSIITQPLLGADCLSTIDVFKRLGVEIDVSDVVTVTSPGVMNFSEPVQALYTGNSGTTTRLLAGMLSGLPFRTVLYGDASIGKRPMDRVIKPLKLMNAAISGSYNDTRTPLIIEPSTMTGIDYSMEVASAQVKSAILLAGLFADGPVRIKESKATRNHTETMLPHYGVKLEVSGDTISLPARSIKTLKPANFKVPGDISSAAFLMVAALITPGSDILLRDVGINHTRTGIIDVIKQMGGAIDVSPASSGSEPVADIRVRYTKDLQPVVIEGDLIPRLIDEIPIIALLLSQADGTSTIKDAEELKVKETNRIDATADELGKLGVSIDKTDDGMIVHRADKLNAAEVDSMGDHRIGMMLAVASLLIDDPLVINDFDCVAVSFPDFLETMKTLGA